MNRLPALAGDAAQRLRGAVDVHVADVELRGQNLRQHERAVLGVGHEDHAPELAAVVLAQPRQLQHVGAALERVGFRRGACDAGDVVAVQQLAGLRLLRAGAHDDELLAGHRQRVAVRAGRRVEEVERGGQVGVVQVEAGLVVRERRQAGAVRIRLVVRREEVLRVVLVGHGGRGAQADQVGELRLHLDLALRDDGRAVVLHDAIEVNELGIARDQLGVGSPLLVADRELGELGQGARDLFVDGARLGAVAEERDRENRGLTDRGDALAAVADPAHLARDGRGQERANGQLGVDLGQ